MSSGRGALPPGAAAYAFEEAERRRSAETAIVSTLVAAGYREAIVPTADYWAPYAPHVGAREERELYRFVDRHGETLALRTDFTIALARHLAPRLEDSDGPARVFYRGEVLRGGSSNGSRDEFYQVGAELLGAAGSEADREIVLRCLDALRACGAGPWHFTLSSTGALEALLADAGPERAPRILAAVRRRASAEAARLGSEVSPEWGDLARCLAQGSLEQDDPRLAGIAGGETLVRAARALAEAGVAEAAIDLADAAPRSYYSGFFFSVFGPTGGEPVAGGGRYDGLYGEFGASRPAVGFSLGLEGALA